jgi:hypothetical protein
MFVVVVFVGLLIAGLYLQELDWKNVGVASLVFVAVTVLAGVFGFPALAFTAIMAVLDIVLVLMVFKGDIRA